MPLPPFRTTGFTTEELELMERQSPGCLKSSIELLGLEKVKVVVHNAGYTTVSGWHIGVLDNGERCMCMVCSHRVPFIIKALVARVNTTCACGSYSCNVDSQHLCIKPRGTTDLEQIASLVLAMESGDW